MAANNATIELNFEFTLAQNPTEHKLNALKSADRALAVIAMPDRGEEPMGDDPTPSVEIIADAQDAEDLRGLADLFKVLAEATTQAADQLEAHNDNTTKEN